MLRSALQSPSLQPGQAPGLWLCCSSSPWAAAPSPCQPGASPQCLWGAWRGVWTCCSHVLHTSSEREGLLQPLLIWGPHVWMLRHGRGCSHICPAELWLPGLFAATALPGCCSCSAAAPSLSPSCLSSVPWGRFLGASLLVLYLGLTWSRKVSPEQGPCPARCAGWPLPHGHGPPPPQSPKQGLELCLCLASLAMRGNSQFPRELLSPGQPRSPNIYISHYCLHMSLFSGGVSSFPLLPQCSPCSISSGADIPNAVLCSH